MMTNNKQIITYPSARDLKTILSENVRKSDLLSFLRTKGIFFFNITPDELAGKVSEMILDINDLQKLRALAYKNTNKQILNGFSLISDGVFDLSNIYETIRKQGDFDGYKLNSIVKKKTSSGDIYEASLTYTKKMPGRIEFIRCEERDVSFVMKHLDEKHWQVEVDGGKSSDGKTIYTMLEKMIKGRNISISMLRIDYLTRAETIDFFDQLAQEGLGENWEIEDIKRITLKQNAGNTDDSSENEKEATPEQLSGITQAILEGKNLRENNFVKQAEESGYAFTSMTYIFFNPKETKKVELRAEFKGNPKMFEVCLETYLEPSVDSNGEYEESLSHLSDNDNINIRSTFWNSAKKIYNTLIKHQKENGV